ncbi:MAG: glucose 1-dehydrogenase [Eubacteriales bacterium]|nr:glucose 1-dehydrogenase [Eubacteriales bacterium]
MNGRVAIVTGGTRGMGRAISVDLAQKGVTVCAVYRSDEKSAKETEDVLKAIEPESFVLQGDVSSQKAANTIVEKVYEKLGRVDILVNNAGIFDFCYIEDMTEEYLDRIMAVNFKSQLFMIKAVLPHMKECKYGRIVNAASISGHFADCGLVGYGASKASVEMLTKIGAGELGPYGITVNAYAPGIIDTDMTHEMICERGDEQVRDMCLQKFGTPEDAASLVGFLASEDAGYITGEIVGVDGGMFKVQNAYLAHVRASEETNKTL